MRYTLELDIDLPRERVIQLFLDENNLKKWQPDIVSFERIKGENAREVGAQSKQIHRMGNSEIEMLETIVEADHPTKYAATYEAKNVWNLVENQFDEIDGKTHWTVTSEFKCKGFVAIIAFLMPGSFKKQTLDFMHKFKNFAEAS